MLDTCPADQCVFTVHQNRRWDGDFLAVKALLDEGKLGNVVMIQSRLAFGPYTKASGWGLQKQFTGGGAFLSFGPHLIDQRLVDRAARPGLCPWDRPLDHERGRLFPLHARVRRRLDRPDRGQPREPHALRTQLDRDVRAGRYPDLDRGKQRAHASGSERTTARTPGRPCPPTRPCTSTASHSTAISTRRSAREALSPSTPNSLASTSPSPRPSPAHPRPKVVSSALMPWRGAPFASTALAPFGLRFPLDSC